MKAMTREELGEKFARIRPWQRRGERAPHKPLLLLYAPGRLSERWLPWAEVKADLGRLLEEFGPPRRTKPRGPFVHLCSDGLWTFFPSGVVSLKDNPSESVFDTRSPVAFPRMFTNY